MKKHGFSIAAWYLMLVFLCLAATWLAFFAVDVFDVANSRGNIRHLPFNDQGLVLIWLFGEGGPIEILQWASNICSLGLCFSFAILHDSRGEPYISRTFRFGTMGFLLLLLEDIGNVRHFFALSIRYYLYEEMDYTGEGMQVHTISDIIFYSLLGALMVYFFWRVYPALKKASHARSFLIVGYICYGIAAFASATRYIADWYEHLGSILIAPVYPNMNSIFLADNTDYTMHSLGYWIVDLLLEESLELIAASALLTTFLIYMSCLARPYTR